MFYSSAMESGSDKNDFKPSKRSVDVKSYRPISLLSITLEVMELLLLKELTPIVEAQRLIPDNQFGFRKTNMASLKKFIESLMQ